MPGFLARTKDLLGGFGLSVPDAVRSTSPAQGDDPPFVKALRSQAQPQAQGSSGITVYYGRIVGEEDNEDLVGPKWYGDSSSAGIADEMMRTDPHCNSLVEVHKAPLIQATWDYSYPDAALGDSGEFSPVQREMQAFSRWNFFELLAWKASVRQILDYLRAGFSLLSATTDIVEVPAERFPLHPSPTLPNGNKRVLAVTGLEQRASRTVWQWVMDPKRPSRVLGVVQMTVKSDVSAGGRQLVESVDPVTGAPRLLRFSFNPTGNNPEGQSLLRPAFGAYTIKKVLTLTDAIRHERQNNGLPTVKMPKGFSKADEKRATKILEAVRGHERAYIVLPDGFVFEWNTTGSGSGTNIHQALERYNRDIWIAGRATYMLLGNGDTGSYAMADALKATLSLDHECHVDTVAAPFNQGVDGPGLNPWLLAQNYGPQTWYPMLGASNLPSMNWEKLLPLVGRLVDSAILTADDRLEEQVRAIMKLAPRDKKTSRVSPKLLTADARAGIKDPLANPDDSTAGPDGSVAGPLAPSKKPATAGADDGMETPAQTSARDGEGKP